MNGYKKGSNKNEKNCNLSFYSIAQKKIKISQIQKVQRQLPLA